MLSGRTLRNVEEEIARIESTHLGFEDHGIFSITVRFEGDGWGQGFGPIFFREDVVKAILKACGTSTWEGLKGRVVFVLRDKPFDLIRGMKPLPINSGQGFVLNSEGELELL